jgi:hypothetical protein
MIKLAAFCAALFSCLAFAPASASAATPDQPPPYFTAHLLTANGSGCPPGSADVTQLSDTTFTVTYSQYIASAGGGADPIDFRKNCQLNVNVGVPSGWTFGIQEVDYRGYAHLGNGARGTLVASYYYAGLPSTYHQQHPMYGPTDGDYEFNDLAGVIAYAPCHANVGLNINTEVRAYTGSDKSYLNVLTMDSTDVSESTIYHLSFRHCM